MVTLSDMQGLQTNSIKSTKHFLRGKTKRRITPRRNRTKYTYDIENRLTSASGAKNATLKYDPRGRLDEISGGATTTYFLYDGDALVAEYDSSGNVTKRYMHGAGIDEPLIEYSGAAVSSATRKNLYTDHLGSITAMTDSSGSSVEINWYDSYGIPAAQNSGRFAYTGQILIPELDLYHYKARAYSPYLGRFLQTDPIGYEDQMNLYAYVGNDPVNKVDPFGLRNCPPNDEFCVETPESEQLPGSPPDKSDSTRTMEEIVVTGQQTKRSNKGRIIFTDGKERFFVVDQSGLTPRKLKQKDVRCSRNNYITVGRAAPLSSGTAGAHSHSTEHGSVPGSGDHNAANGSTTGVAFMMSISRVFTIESFSNGTYRTTIPAGGPLNTSERAELVENMRNWENPAKSSDSSKSDKERFCP